MTEKEEHFFIRGQLDAVKKMINFLDNYTKTNVNFESSAIYDQGKVHALFDFSKALSILNNNLQVDQLANDHDMLMIEEEEKTCSTTSMTTTVYGTSKVLVCGTKRLSSSSATI